MAVHTPKSCSSLIRAIQHKADKKASTQLTATQPASQSVSQSFIHFFGVVQVS